MVHHTDKHAVICKGQYVTLPDELVLPIGKLETPTSSAKALTIVKAARDGSTFVNDIPWLDILETKDFLPVKHICMLMLCCQKLHHLMDRARYWRYLIDCQNNTRMSFSHSADPNRYEFVSIYDREKRSGIRAHGTALHPILMAREVKALRVKRLDFGSGGTRPCFDVNVIYDKYQPLLAEELDHVADLWGYVQNTGQVKWLLCRCENTAYLDAEMDKYNRLVAQHIESGDAFKQVFIDSSRYGSLSVDILRGFVKPMSDASMRWVMPATDQELDPMSEQMQIIMPFWCKACKIVTCSVCFCCNVDLSGCTYAFDNPVVARMLVQVCRTRIMSNTSRMYLRNQSATVALASYVDVGTFTFDVTDGKNTMAVNVSEERFKRLFFHASRKDPTSHNPLAGAMLLMSLRVKDMHGIFANFVLRNVVDQPYIKEQGPFQLLNFMAMGVEFVNFNSTTYSGDDVFSPNDWWGYKNYDLTCTETLVTGQMWEEDELSSDDDWLLSPVASADAGSDAGSDADSNTSGTVPHPSPASDTVTESDFDEVDGE